MSILFKAVGFGTFIYSNIHEKKNAPTNDWGYQHEKKTYKEKKNVKNVANFEKWTDVKSRIKREMYEQKKKHLS